MAIKCFYILYSFKQSFNCPSSLTLLLFKLVLCQEDGSRQLPDRWLNWHEEFPGVSAESGERCEKKCHFKTQRNSSFSSVFRLHYERTCRVLTCTSHHSWKFAACVESQKSMPITAVAVSPAGSSSVDTQEEKDLFSQQLSQVLSLTN